MKDIKFRAWLPTIKEMFFNTHGDLAVGCTDADGDPIQEWSPWVFEIPTGFALDNAVLMQYTGLKDKNGKEIYEGDIILDHIQGSGVEGFKDNVGQVIQSPGGEWIWYRHNNELDQISGGDSLLNWIEDREVIGNIYENPELLTK